MTRDMTRRMFLQASAASAAVSTLASRGSHAEDRAAPAEKADGAARPVVISSGNGLPATAKAAELLHTGRDALDAVIAGVNIVEADPNDHTVGLGGLPNEDGVVELDSSVMHGPTHRGGAVAALRNIVHPSLVAKAVMEGTDHVLLVGEGALRFARAHGFEETNLLTDEARRIWLRWKERHSDRDDWVPSGADQDEDIGAGISPALDYTYGTIHCSAVDAQGNLSGVTSTSGLSYKIPGRVGDSPIIGAGLFVDNEVGAAGATGRGEAVILNAGAASVVELMRSGRSPQEACLGVLKRISDRTKDPRLLNSAGRPNYNVILYAVSKDGRLGCASMWSGEGGKARQFAAYSGGHNNLRDAEFLYEMSAEG